MIELPSTTGQDVRTCVVRTMIEHSVQRDIFCTLTGRVLDIDTCVALVGMPADDDVMIVMSPEAWASAETEVRSTRTFIDNNLTVWVGRIEQPGTVPA